jgi:hypothetical protein
MPELTLTQVHESMQNSLMSLKTEIQGQFEEVKKRMKSDFDETHARMQKTEHFVRAIHQTQETHLEETKDIKRRIGNMEIRTEDIRDSLAELIGLEEKDALATVNHELRIRDVEKFAGIKGVSPLHLADLE